MEATLARMGNHPFSPGKKPIHVLRWGRGGEEGHNRMGERENKRRAIQRWEKKRMLSGVTRNEKPGGRQH